MSDFQKQVVIAEDAKLPDLDAQTFISRYERVNATPQNVWAYLADKKRLSREDQRIVEAHFKGEPFLTALPTVRIDTSGTRVMCLELDELHTLWDALQRHRLALPPGEPEHDETMALLKRVERLRQ